MLAARLGGVRAPQGGVHTNAAHLIECRAAWIGANGITKQRQHPAAHHGRGDVLQRRGDLRRGEVAAHGEDDRLAVVRRVEQLLQDTLAFALVSSSQMSLRDPLAKALTEMKSSILRPLPSFLIPSIIALQTPSATAASEDSFPVT